MALLVVMKALNLLFAAEDKHYVKVLANVASVVIGETGPFIGSLRETSRPSGKAARNLAKLTLFRQFYIVMVIGYLYFTSCGFCIEDNFSLQCNGWHAIMADIELSFLHCHVLHVSRPVERNEYFVLDDEGRSCNHWLSGTRSLSCDFEIWRLFSSHHFIHS
ncbi:hypothetical protein HAX54_024917 [Datura stramonium]|uniref:Uncharacterized protein n=1 Tax=Datura stramonium TaxID=4076 RepID=A0ABS8V136_DATST|nr:hypothetical protein [Datura stramonium]